MLMHPVMTHEPSELSKDEKQQYIDFAVRAAFQVVEKSMIHGGTVHWSKHSQDGDIKLYTSNDRSGSALFCGVMDVGGSLGDVIDYLNNFEKGSTTEFPLSHDKKWLHETTIHTIENSEYERIKLMWRAFRCPLGEPVNRDMCLLEFENTFPYQNRTGYVNFSQSVSLECCPPQASPNFIRAINHGSGHVVVEGDKPGVLHLAYVTHVDLKVQPALRSLARQAMVGSCGVALRHVEQHLRTRRTLRNQCHLGLVVNTVPKAIRRYCYLCTAKFSLTTSKRHCVHCGEVICSSCHREPFVQNSTIKRISLCTSCCHSLPPFMMILTKPAVPEKSKFARFFSRSRDTAVSRRLEESNHSVLTRSPESSNESQYDADTVASLTRRLSELADVMQDVDKQRSGRMSVIDSSACMSVSSVSSSRGNPFEAKSTNKWGLSVSTTQILMACSR